MNLLATFVIFAAVIYLQGFRVEIPVKSSKQRGMRGSYPVRLFYTSNMPIMLQSALASNFFLISQMLFSRFSDNLLVKMLGTWEPKEGSAQLFAASGIAYYMSPPADLKGALLDPVHTAIYIVFIMTACAVFSKTWIEVSGSAPRDVAKQLKVIPSTDPSDMGKGRLLTGHDRNKDLSWPATESKVCTRNSSVSFPRLRHSVVPALVPSQSQVISSVHSALVLVSYSLSRKPHSSSQDCQISCGHTDHPTGSSMAISKSLQRRVTWLA